MDTEQTRQDPDVNTFDIGDDSDEDVGRGSGGTTNVEIPVPPDTPHGAPVEEPPGSDGPPVGDVDDSPKQIAR